MYNNIVYFLINGKWSVIKMSENRQNSISKDNDSLFVIDFYKMIHDHIIAIVVIAAIMAVLSYVRVAFFSADTYTATGVLYVSSKDDANSKSESVQMNDMVTSMTMATTYIETLKTRSFLESVSNDIDNKYTYKQISSMMSLSIINDTELIEIKIKALLPEDAYAICQSVLENAPQKLHTIYPGGSIKIVDPAYFPAKPDGKGTTFNAIIGFVLGAVLGCAYAFIYTLLDVKLRKASDFGTRYNAPVLGQVPKGKEQRNIKAVSDKKRFDFTNNILKENTDFNIIETYKSIRTNIMFSIPKSEKGNAIVVTSAAPGEGKTTTTTNVAITFAQVNAKVILVDCDLRKSRMHRYLDVEDGQGVTNVLCGFCKLEDAIKKNVRDNLDVLVAGEFAPNPAELLASEAFDKMIEELREKYDYIFIDTPPITVVTDASIIMPKSQGVVVVAKEGSTNINLLDETISGVRNLGANLIGGLVICVDNKGGKHVYYKKMAYDYYAYESEK